MAQRTRRRALGLALALVLAFPLAGFAAEDDDAPAEDSNPAAKKERSAKPDEAESYSDEESEGEEGGAEGEAIDWEITHRGLYLLANGSYDFMVNRSDLESRAEDAAGITSANSNTDDSWGYGGRIGWRIIDRLAVEGQFQMLNRVEIHSHVPGGSDLRSRATFMTAMGNAKAYLLTERIQPYALAGLGYGYAELRPPGGGTKDRDDGFAAQFGAGTDFYVTDNLGVMTEVAYVLPTGDIDDYDYVALYFGVLLRFYGSP